MQYEDFFDSLLATYEDAAIVSTCGHISRDLFNHTDRAGNFYLVGSMGMAGPVALGISLVKPSQMVIAIDGDGSAAMNLSGFASIATTGNRILHVVLDNGQHGSTGGQSVAAVRNLPRLATELGYRTSMSINDTTEGVGERLAAIHQFPAFVHVQVAPRVHGVGDRVRHTPQELRDRLMQYLTPNHTQQGK